MSQSSDERDPLDLATEEFAARIRSGQRPSISEFVSRYPDLAVKIQQLFPTILALDELNALLPNDRHGEPAAASETTFPHQIGDFELIREIGRGGMGVVFEAIQASLGRLVALKVLPIDRAASETSVERFRREARAAAALHHTNIVPVFGVGEVDGRLYYAMQYIDGQGLDCVLDAVRRLHGKPASSERARPASSQAADMARRLHTSSGSNVAGSNVDASQPRSDKFHSPRHGWTRLSRSSSSTSASKDTVAYIRSIAQLTAQVADALAYAHRQGVVHRDVKPSNLLLDLQGTVWLADFGLARAEGSDGLTETGDLVGTLRYMPPERFRGESSPQGDVYSLGLTLYELLTHEPAVPSGDRARTIDQILHSEPPPLRTIDRRIPRDLETIVGKAFAKDLKDRYASAEAFRDDLERFLRDEPIRARPLGPTERFSRWAKRNPALASLSMAMLAMLLIVAGGATAAALRLAAARDREVSARQLAQDKAAAEQRARELADKSEARAAAEAQRAERKASEANQVSTFLLNLFQGADPLQSGFVHSGTLEPGLTPADRTAGELLDVGTAKLLVDLKSKPGECVPLVLNVARVYLAQGEISRAQRLFEAVLALSPDVFQDSPQWLGQACDGLGVIQAHSGQLDEAIEHHTRALAIASTLGPEFWEWQAQAHNNLARALLQAKRFEESEREFDSARTISSKLPADRQQALPLAIEGLACIENERGNSEKAESLFREAVAMGEQVFGPSHPATRLIVHELACRLPIQVAEKERLLRENIANWRATLGESHQLVLRGQSDLGLTLAAQPSRRSEGLTMLEGAVAGFSKSLHSALKFSSDVQPGSSADGPSQVLKFSSNSEADDGELLPCPAGNRFPLPYEQRLLLASYATLQADRAHLLRAEGRLEESAKAAERAVTAATWLVQDSANRLASCIVSLVQTWVKQRRATEATLIAGNVLAIRLRIAQDADLGVGSLATSALEHLAAGRIDEYRSSCRQLFDQYSQSTNPHVGLTVVRVCTAGPDALADLTVLRPVIEQALARLRDQNEFICFRGASLYRVGEFHKAADSLGIYAVVGETTCFGTAYDRLFLAMSLARLGQKASALKWYNSACAWLDATSQGPDRLEPATTAALREASLPAPSATGFDMPAILSVTTAYHQGTLWRDAEILRAEARAVLTETGILSAPPAERDGL